jgi:transcriptional regulator with XRE-family HTH domain
MKLSLDAWRRARGISQQDVADVCGIHINTYRRWEENPGEMRYDKAIKVADYLGISLDDILLPSDTTETSITEERR